ncbi:MAG: MmcQ/YjbR family DNA-binding protein [Chitinophagaceae bacterium]|nr:MmcQ/YjbR family DNA-binding protein [Chitinophagaceae bacterium]
MTTLEQIRQIAMDLPAVTETLHFRLPCFKIGDRGVITVQKGAAIISMAEDMCKALADSEPDKYELVIRNKKYFIGLKINLNLVTPAEIKPLIATAWEFQKNKMK